MTSDIPVVLFIDFLCGSLLTFLVFKFYFYCWWSPSFLNMDWLKRFINNEEDYPIYKYALCVLGVVISFVVQFSLPAGCLVIKKLLSSELSIFDSVAICSVPTVYIWVDKLRWLWVDYTDGREMKFPFYPGSSTSKSAVEKIRNELIEMHEQVSTEEAKYQEHEVIGYVFRWRTNFSKSLSRQAKIESFILVPLGCFLTCLVGGFIGYWLIHV